MVIAVTPTQGLTLRPYAAADQPAILKLINADRMPGQPQAIPAMLTEALKGRSPIDSGWWAELERPTTRVAVDAAGVVMGVVSYAARPKDDTGQLLWLHCREDAATADTLIRHAVAALAPRPVHAFHFASALSLGLEALPVRHRPATAHVLESAGFTGARLWRYMRRDLPAPACPTSATSR